MYEEGGCLAGCEAPACVFLDAVRRTLVPD